MRKPSLHERTGRLGWEDLRTVLAVARAGSLAGAARALEIRHSTVFRRVADVERRLGVKLFERARSGWQANSEGEAVAEAAAVMEEAALGAERRVQGADERLTGTIRIATSEMLAGFLLPRPVAQFLSAHPAIEIELDIANRNVDLTRREADFAVRATTAPNDSLVGREIAQIRYAAYAAPALLPRGRATPDLERLPWLGFDERIAHLGIARWFAETLPGVRPRLRVDSLSAMLRLGAEGVGAVVLPVFAAAREPKLVRITPVIPNQRMSIWLLNHPDMRSNARVRALALHLAATIPGELERLLGEGPCCGELAACPRAERGRRR
jgi:DNA-binding transcriptional LysR family regulator